MRVSVGGHWVAYTVKSRNLLALKDKDVVRGCAAREHVFNSVRAWLRAGMFDVHYVTAAMNALQRAMNRQTDPFYWMQLRGKMGSDILTMWEEEQGISIERRARSHRRAMPPVPATSGEIA